MYEHKFTVLASDMVQMFNQMRIDEKYIEQQQETIDNLEKLRDTQSKLAGENTEKVSID